MRLSLAMIAKNEEAVIGHCLESVRDLADEMIVVDTGSSDATAAISGQHGAIVHHFPWQNDFAQARNESLRHCHGDWILILDADEAVDLLDHEQIRKACAQDKTSAFRLTLRNYFAHGGQSTLDIPAQLNTSHYTEGRDCSYFADFKGLRLCRRLPELHFTGRIHELLDPFFEARDLAIGSLDAVIHHYGKLFADRESLKKRYYLDLALQDVEAQPNNYQYQFNLVQQALMAQEWPIVLKACEAYMRLRSTVPPSLLFAFAIALQFQERHSEALVKLGQLLKAMPKHAAGLTRQGISLAVLGRLDEARKAFKKATAAQPNFLMPTINLAELESNQGDHHTARTILRSALNSCPNDPKLLETLVRLNLKAQDSEGAVQDAWMALQRCPAGGQGMWHRLVAVWLLKQKHPTQALAILDAGIQSFPTDTELLRLREMAISPDGQG